MGLLDFLHKKRPLASSAGMGRLADEDEALRRTSLRFAEKAGLCYRASDACRETIRKIASYPRGSGITVSCTFAEDTYGCAWIVLSGDLGRLVESARAAYDSVMAGGCGHEFLCAAFAYDREGKKVYWIFNSAGKFYPFAPEGGEDRDNSVELDLRRELGEKLPLEGALSQWYPLWNMPF